MMRESVIPSVRVRGGGKALGALIPTPTHTGRPLIELLVDILAVCKEVALAAS
jgi:hypothetical protein